LLTLVVATGLLVGLAVPAQADSGPVQKKSVSVNGRSGTVARYADRSGGKVANYVTVSSNDSDGSGGGCTETWWDYSTKPHLHFNPGVVVNCSGGSRTLSGIHGTSYSGIAGVGVVVCDVPNTNGPISRSSKNCRGSLGSMYLHSGQKYSRFGVSAMQHPSGVKIYRT
jgi:hypothetical protein